ncbi:MAG: type II toxin-antitoxin system VapC family toxin [Chloroflexi bacterium]|nr:type II toxin-antitoxin system VapC family toxin [Chloroflexota bacterium]
MVDFVFSRATEDRLVTSFLAAVELAGAAHRLKKSNVLDEAAASEFVAQFNEDMMAVLQVFPISDSTVAVAVGIAEHYGLRAADSIHLSTMTEIRTASMGAETELIALVADKSLLRAAAQEGITVANPDEDGALDKLRNLLSL